MKIMCYKSGHSGHIAYLDNGQLKFSLEAEKDNWPRYEVMTPTLNLRCMEYIHEMPDVVAMSGWIKGFHSVSDAVDGGYYGEGVDTIVEREQNFLGSKIKVFSSSHERSHLMGAYGMSPFPQGKPCYALVWEGTFGAFYRIDENVNITKIGEVVSYPGGKYGFIYGLADPEFPVNSGNFRLQDAGKLMALCSYGEPGPANSEDQALIDKILDQEKILLTLDKGDLKDTPYFNIGVESQKFKDFARKFSDNLFQRFHDFAKEHLTEGLPLLISGGCGLNCDWNTDWVKTGLFEEVFVAPCTNDSGSAIGTAIDAQFFYTNNAKIDWNVYAGEVFVHDEVDLSDFDVEPLNVEKVAHYLTKGNVFGWVQGKYEIGPRALGNRSIIAMPFTKDIHLRLNKIKSREGFRPIAPICLEEDMDLWFDHHGPSPYMLFFQKVKTDALKAITHVDGSARLQSVTKQSNVQMYNLLSEFKNQTDYGVLCNTSLNFNGFGFINHLSDLVKYTKEHGLDGFVVDDKFYRLKIKN